MFSGNEANYQATTISNDGFWPDIAVADFERRGVVPADVDPSAVAGAVLAAVAEINPLLEARKAEWLDQGYKRAQDVPGPSLAPGINQTTELYWQAVFARAKADMITEWNTATQRAAANNQAVSARETRDSLLAISQQRIRTLKLRGRVGVSLI